MREEFKHEINSSSEWRSRVPACEICLESLTEQGDYCVFITLKGKFIFLSN